MLNMTHELIIKIMNSSQNLNLYSKYNNSKIQFYKKIITFKWDLYNLYKMAI